jgi:oxygen-independent coproporphyrinogen-3 oxidase
LQASILQKYGEARLPRYTSYPTAPRFSSSIGPVAYADWLAGLPRDEAVSLYLHVPFCRSMCWYCGCHTTITGRDQPIADYLGVLREEIGLVSTRTPARLAVEKVHFGGGTPTIIKPEEFIALADLLRERFEFTPSAEMAVEIDPRTLSAGMAAAADPAIEEMLPPEWRELAEQVHAGFDSIAVAVRQARETSAVPDTVLARLVRVTAACSSCHSTYRLHAP